MGYTAHKQPNDAPQMLPLPLKFGRDRECTKVNSCTKFELQCAVQIIAWTE